MARVQIDDLVIGRVSGALSGMQGATVGVYTAASTAIPTDQVAAWQVASGTLASVYVGPTGTTKVSNPQAVDQYGRYTGWVDTGADYDVVISSPAGALAFRRLALSLTGGGGGSTTTTVVAGEPNTFGLFGASLEQNNGPVGTSTPVGGPYPAVTTVAGYGYYSWAAYLLGGRTRRVVNAGVSGNTTAMMLARIGSDVLSLSPQPGWWIVGCPTPNDYGSGQLSATAIIANLKSIYDQILALGKPRLVMLNHLPYDAGANGTVSGLSAAQYHDNVRQINAFIADYALKNPQSLVFDVAAASTDPTTGKFKTGHSNDGIHYNYVGAYRAGQLLARLLDPYLGKTSGLVTSALDPTNLMGSMSFNQGTGGNFLGSTNAGLAAGWTVAGPAGSTCAIVAGGDGLGNWQKLTLGGSGTLTLYCAIGAQPVGTTVVAEAEVRTDNDWVNPTNFGLVIAPSSAANAVSMDTVGLSPAPGAVPNPGAGVLRTLPITLPDAGVSSLPAVRFTADAGTIYVRRFAWRNS